LSALSLFLCLPAVLSAQVPQSNHVVVVLEENHSYSSVIGNSAMPYLNSLASQNALATQYFANTHPSIGNYFMMTSGQIITNDDGFSGTVSADNMVRQLLSAGKTWKSYAESLPSVGYTGGDVFPYVRHHNPFSFFSDVVNSNAQVLNLAPFSQFPADLNNGQLPNFSFVVPNIQNDAHDCPAGMSSCSDNQKLAAADAWLQSNIAPLLNNAAFQQDGLLIIVFDEGFDTDTGFGGGQVPVVMVGPNVKKGFQSSGLYQHENLLRTILDALGVNSYPGQAVFALDMADMFSANPNPTPTPTPTPTGGCNAQGTGVTVCSPASGSSQSSPVHFTASASSNHPINAIRIYVDNVSAYTVHASSLDTSLALSSGNHFVVVQAWDSTGAVFKTPLNLTVTGASVCSAVNTGVTVCLPSGNSVASPVHVVAAAKSASAPITAMRIYVDNVSQYLTFSSSLDTSLALSSGPHFLVVQAWDATGAVFKNPQNINVP
jgi:acid phosphatase